MGLSRVSQIYKHMTQFSQSLSQMLPLLPRFGSMHHTNQLSKEKPRGLFDMLQLHKLLERDKCKPCVMNSKFKSYDVLLV